MTNLYTVKRDDICVGKVITEFEISEKKDNLNGQEITIGSSYSYRNMLFIKDYDNYSEDLLYTSPKYPIFTSDNVDVCLKHNIIIKQAHNISRLLRYFDYPAEMTFLDVIAMRNRLFNGKFPIENADSFGLMELDAKHQTYYDLKGNIITDPTLLKPLIKQRERMRAFGQYYEFINSDDFDGLTQEQIERVILPKEYFDILREHGDHSLYDVMCGYEERINSFKPNKAEGPIRSLKKYN